MINGNEYYVKKINGKPLYGKTVAELERKIKVAETSVKAKKDVSEITLGDYIIDWHESIEGDVAKSTHENYGYFCLEIIKRIGNKKLIDCTPLLLEDCVKDFSKTKCPKTGDYPSQRYIKGLVVVLKMVFKKAKKGLLVPCNYAEDITVKSRKSKTAKSNKHRSLTDEEIKRIVEFEHPMRMYCLFMLCCGLMPEETVPLTWGDIYFKDGNYVVKINKSAELLGVTVVRANTTKNEYRKRDVQIPSPLAEIVAEKIDEHEKDELIFTNKHGELLSKSGLRKRWNSYLIDMDIFYNDKKKKCDHTKTPEEKVLTIDRFLPYDLRHTYATLLARSNASERNTTALMGHALGSTTDKYYIDFNQLNTAPDVANLAQLIKSITASNKNERTEENESERNL